MGSFVKIQSRDGNEGTTCDSKWSCGKAIYNCLENDQDALELGVETKRLEKRR